MKCACVASEKSVAPATNGHRVRAGLLVHDARDAAALGGRVGQRVEGDEARHAGEPMQRQHERVAEQDQPDVLRATRVARVPGCRSRSGPAWRSGPPRRRPAGDRPRPPRSTAPRAGSPSRGCCSSGAASAWWHRPPAGRRGRRRLPSPAGIGRIKPPLEWGPDPIRSAQGTKMPWRANALPLPSRTSTASSCQIARDPSATAPGTIASKVVVGRARAALGGRRAGARSRDLEREVLRWSRARRGP